MSQTGTYIWDNNLKRLVKVSDAIPRLGFLSEAYVPSGGYVEVNISEKPIEIRSRRQKYNLMREHGVREYERVQPKPKSDITQVAKQAFEKVKGL